MMLPTEFRLIFDTWPPEVAVDEKLDVAHAEPLVGHGVDELPPDTTYLESEAGERYTPTNIYPQLTQAALLEMNRQVGVAEPGQDGWLRRGLTSGTCATIGRMVTSATHPMAIAEIGVHDLRSMEANDCGRFFPKGAQ